MQDLDERKLDEWLALIDKKIRAGGGRDCLLSGVAHPWSSLSDAERITMVGYCFALDVSNGGFEKWFLERGNTWREARHAIKVVGATRLAALFEEALAIFPGRIPSDDYETRHNQCIAARALGGDGLFWRLTGEYYKLQEASAEHCLYQRLTAFAIEHLQKLKEH